MIIGILKGIFSAVVLIFSLAALLTLITVSLLMLGLWIDKKEKNES